MGLQHSSAKRSRATVLYLISNYVRGGVLSREGTSQSCVLKARLDAKEGERDLRVVTLVVR